MPSSPPPDKFQREIDDVIRLAERRLEHQSFSYRMRRSTRRLGNAFGGFSLRLPSPETLGGLGLALLLISWLMTLPIVSGVLLTGNDQTVAARPWREIETEDHNLKGWVLGDFIQLMQPAGGL